VNINLSCRQVHVSERHIKYWLKIPSFLIICWIKCFYWPYISPNTLIKIHSFQCWWQEKVGPPFIWQSY